MLKLAILITLGPFSYVRTAQGSHVRFLTFSFFQSASKLTNALFRVLANNPVALLAIDATVPAFAAIIAHSIPRLRGSALPITPGPGADYLLSVVSSPAWARAQRFSTHVYALYRAPRYFYAGRAQARRAKQVYHASGTTCIGKARNYPKRFNPRKTRGPRAPAAPSGPND